MTTVNESKINPAYPPKPEQKQVKLAAPPTEPLVKVQAEPTPRKAS